MESPSESMRCEDINDPVTPNFRNVSKSVLKKFVKTLTFSKRLCYDPSVSNGTSTKSKLGLENELNGTDSNSMKFEKSSPKEQNTEGKAFGKDIKYEKRETTSHDDNSRIRPTGVSEIASNIVTVLDSLDQIPSRYFIKNLDLKLHHNRHNSILEFQVWKEQITIRQYMTRS